MDIVNTTRRATTFTIAISALMTWRIARTTLADQPDPAADASVKMGPGLPADFPLAPGLKACNPISADKEVLCVWHKVDTHAAYLSYATALPKAGYPILKGAGEVRSPREMGGMGFSKGTLQGAVSVAGSDLTIQVIDTKAK